MAFQLLPQQFGCQFLTPRHPGCRSRPIAPDAPDDVDVADPLTIAYVTGHTRKSCHISNLKIMPLNAGYFGGI